MSPQIELMAAAQTLNSNPQIEQNSHQVQMNDLSASNLLSIASKQNPQNITSTNMINLMVKNF